VFSEKKKKKQEEGTGLLTLVFFFFLFFQFLWLGQFNIPAYIQHEAYISNGSYTAYISSMEISTSIAKLINFKLLNW
jgi:hypothetical protein